MHFNTVQTALLLVILLTMSAEKPPGPPPAAGGAGGNDQKDRKRKESIVDLSRYLDKNIRVKFAGGREASGILKGYDPLLNLVLDDTIEYLRGK